ncbi:MAG: dihydroorotate dehydrogenase [Candidatus Omnitrophota bacterium]|nr:MAG: dihydroorotate dehydrogenase [Candidatus Omnitrophota bacterium]
MDLKIKIGKLKLENPVILASGTAGFGKEMKDFIDINKLGAIVTKTITLNKRKGNPPPRVIETPGGLLNSIGLDNGGLKDFMFEKISFLENLKIPVIVSIAGDTIDEFVELARELSKARCIRAIEINLSCPNIRHKNTKFPLLAQDRRAVEKIISRLRKTTTNTLIAKLSPNVADIKEIAKAAEHAGADAISLINTYPGMLVDINTMKPKLGGVTGGLSGPSVKPLALKCVRDAYNAVNIPVIGMGGIMDARDAVEFFICGASAIQIGTANFVNPGVSLEILEGIKEYLKKKKIKAIKNLIGKLKI